MASSECVFCGICDARHITKTAAYWCPECDEGLCAECHEHHSISKGTRKHGVISMESYYKLPTSIANIVNFCEDHHMKYENYCPHHNKLCCPACISTKHKNCVGLLLLQDVLKTAKSSTLLDSIEVSIKDIKTNIDTIIKNRQDDLNTFRKQREKCQDEIKQLRIKINCHLDGLEQQILNELAAAENKVEIKTNKVVADLSEKTKHADVLQQNIASVKEHGSDLQAYIGSKMIEAAVEIEEKYIQSLIKDGSLQQNLLKCKIDDKIVRLTSIKSFGNISIESGCLSVTLKTEKEKQTQILTSIPLPIERTVDNIKLSIASKIDMTGDLFKKSDIRGAVILSNGQILFADSSQRKLILINNDGTLAKTVLVTSGPYDVSIIGDRKVAMSAFRAVHIIDIDSEEIKDNINTHGECQGIDYHSARGMLICYVKSKGIQSIQLFDKTISTIVQVRGDSKTGLFYIAVHGDNIYESRAEQHTITCYSLVGEKKWVFNNINLLASPMAISVDDNSNLFVSSNFTNSIVALSPDGTICKQLLSVQDGIMRPLALYFDVKKNILLYAEKSGPAFIYNVS
ncbi:uncharacterized protein [Mytilus edulis]|uniref:uncharacterized protein n=1 Tax=Mytilus edulis TaxID=6550 RepID=UPI0039EEC9BD